jgi:hypothetical protein
MFARMARIVIHRPLWMAFTGLVAGAAARPSAPDPEPVITTAAAGQTS